MKLKYAEQVFLFGLILLLVTAFDSEQEVTEKEAIKLAEQFVKNNGYATYPADTSKFRLEFMDGLISHGNVDSIMRWRYNQLYPKAYCILEQKKLPHIGTWTGYEVGFLSTAVKVDKLSRRACKSNLPGRSVLVSIDGSSIEMENSQPLFSHFKKLRKCGESLFN